MVAQKKLCAFAVALVLALWAPSFLRSQQPASQPDAAEKPRQGGFKIGVEVNLVNVPVTVRKSDGGFYRGLPQSAFRILEDGKPQEILFFAQEGLPTHIAIVLDVSGSVRSEWGSIRYATKRFVEHLKPDDRFSITTFNNEIRLKLDWGRKIDRVDPVLNSIYCKDNTKLWDAIWVVCNEVFKGIEGKKAIIIMSDGMDNESSITFDEAVNTAVHSQAAIYVVSKTEAFRQKWEYYFPESPQDSFVVANAVLRKLAHETGGRVLYPNNFGQLDDIYAQVDEELRNQYTLGYISSNTAKDGSYRAINVGVAAKNVTITARPGYYAPAQ